MSRKFCPYCGFLYSGSARTCARCGKAQPHPLPRPHWMMGTLVLTIALSIVFAFGIANHRDYLLKSFKSAQCTILSSEMRVTTHHSHSESNGTTTDEVTYTYSPYFTYTVSLPGGGIIKGSGYSAPGENSYSTPAEVESILKQYRVQQSYDCWYSPIAPKPSALVLVSDSGQNAFFAVLLTVLFLPIGILLFYQRVYKTYRLHRYGKQGHGRILKRNLRPWGSQTQIEFHTEMYPEITWKPIIAGWPWGFPDSSTVAILYDPLDPQHNAADAQSPLPKTRQRWTLWLALAIGIFTLLILALYFL